VPLLPPPLTALRERLRSIATAIGETRTHVLDTRDALSLRLDEIDANLASFGEQLRGLADAQDSEQRHVREVLRAIAAREPQQRQELYRLRAHPDYTLAFSEPDPLVTVPIPTHDTYQLLAERSIPSVLAQTYSNFEVVVVGDAAPQEAASVIKQFNDPRISYFNLPYRGPYPDDPRAKWYAGGIPPFNEAVRRARGRWIAPLNDDDAFRPQHIELLLDRARTENFEAVYGNADVHSPDGSSTLVGGYPPAHGRMVLQTAIYHAGLAPIFPLELTDALFELPMDWGVCLRMTRAGVWVGWLDAIVTDGYPSALWLSREGASAP
jgi:hypothetical protein